MGKHWLISTRSPQQEASARRWGVPSIVAQLLLNRGISADEQCREFLTPQMKDLYPPNLLPGTAQAAAAIVEAVRANDKIVIYGDYDVDGITGLAIIWHTLRLAGAEVSFYVPHRIDEGYGLNREAVERIADDGAGMIITVDCGITAVDEARILRRRGVKLIITDHHLPQERVPEADGIVHPALDGSYPNPDLCGAGVAFKLSWAIAQLLSGAERVTPELRVLMLDMLPLVALGTIADVVPLRGENRIIARHGLEALTEPRLPGLVALMDAVGLTGEKVSGYDVGFKLAPRINAAGRMGHARLAVELFTRADPDRAREIALYLEEHNRSRQATERKIARQVHEIVERDGLASDARRAIVLASESWHAGVIGIVAARVVDRYQRPTILISLNNGEGQGSGRSIRHFDLASALEACSEHLVSHGGHAMAAGLRIDANRIKAFTEAFVDVANNRLTGADLVPKLRIDAEVDLPEMTLPTAEAILGLGPFGQGNPKPRLATGWVDLAAEPRCVGRQQNHLQTTFRQDGAVLKGIGFGLGEHAEDLKQHRRCRVAFEPIINDFNNRRTVELQILDLQFPG